MKLRHGVIDIGSSNLDNLIFNYSSQSQILDASLNSISLSSQFSLAILCAMTNNRLNMYQMT